MGNTKQPLALSKYMGVDIHVGNDSNIRLLDNSPTNQLTVRQVADLSTRGLVNSPTAKITLCNTLQPELKPNPNPIDY